ncbi:MAG: SGNH/GDSL hydrolase family protein [Flavobacterium sp.]
MNTSKSYFFQSFLIVLLAAIFFLGIKEVLPSKIFSENSGTTKNVLVDSMLIDAFEAEKMAENSDSEDAVMNQPIKFVETNGVVFPAESYQNYNGFQYLIPFYENLYQLETSKSGNVRIAYFGDSMTDGDMIVQDFRNNFQTQFGGHGVGFVSITSESAASRSSIAHEFSQNWKTQSYLNIKYPTRSFGVNGHVFFANDTIKPTWVKFKAGRSELTNQLNQPTLFYGSSSNSEGSITYQVGIDSVRKKLVATNLLNTLSLSQTDLKSLKVNFKKATKIPVYGFNFDDGQGVHIDNFSQRGNSGIPISNFDVDLMRAFHQKLNYDLIVLHYGTNVLNYGTKSYSWYAKNMTKTVNRLKECFPGVSILIVSTADKSTKYGTEMKTDSAVIPLTRAQKNYALQTQSGFVNLYTLMGGNGSMTRWVEEEPALANKDYTHFNFRGSKKIAHLLYNHLNKGYVKYKVLRNKRIKPFSYGITYNKAVPNKTDRSNVQ